MQAKDVMTGSVISVGPDTDVGEIARLLTEKRISAVPVVDAGQRILGIVSEGDLLRRTESGTEKKRGSWWLGLLTRPEELAGEYAKSHGRRASDVMTRDVISVGEDTSVAEIAEILEEKHIKRVPVVRDGQLVGIVSRANLLQGLVATSRRSPPPPVAASDAALRERVLAALKDQPWSSMAYANVTVEGGVVHLWGMVETTEQIKAFEVAAREVPGVKSVESHLNPIDRHFYYGE